MRLAALKECFSLDLRSVGLFRIGIGTVLTLDAVIRLTDLTAHYTSLGTLPGPTYLETLLLPLLPQALKAHPGFLFGTILSLVALAGVSIAAGLLPRRLALVAWFLLIQVHAKNYMVLNSGDILLRLMLFWAAFLPLGARFNLIRRWKGIPESTATRCSGGPAAAFGLQLAFVYVTTGLFKSAPEWWPNGTAVYYALSLDQFTTPLGQWLVQFHEPLRFLTYFVYFLEVFGPLLFFAPWGAARTAGVLLFMGMHFGFILTMRIGCFPWIDIICLSALLPAWFWERLSRLRVGRLAIPAWVTARSVPTQAIRPGLMAQTISGLLICYVGLWNASHFSWTRVRGLGDWDIIADYLRIEQKWNMFSPRPAMNDGWYVIPGATADGREIDLFKWDQHPQKYERELPGVSYDKPAQVSLSYKNEHWRKFMMNLSLADQSVHRPNYARYLCHAFNHSRPPKDQVVRLDIVFVRENTPPPGEPAKVFRSTFLTHLCREADRQALASVGP
jgi:hypothetical protein